MNGGSNMQLILFPLPYEGHMNPMLHLAQILHSKGFSITIIHIQHINSPHPSDYPSFTFRSIPHGLSGSDVTSRGVVEIITLVNDGRCVEPLRKCVAELVAASNIGCLITDAHWHFTQSVADEFQIRRVVLRTGNISAFLAMVGLPDLRRNGLLRSSEDPLPDFPHLRVKDLPAVKAQSPLLIEQLLSSILIQTKASSALILNSFNDLEHEPLLRCPSTHTNFPSSSTPPLLSLLAQHKPRKSVLYVSFGTLATIDPHEFVEIAWGLANSSYCFLWVVRPGMVSGSEWLESLPDGFVEMVGERGLIVKWAPQREVLAHPAIGGFWTHNGWNSTIESICEGVPMLCYPCLGDQMANARYVSDVWGIGLLLGDKLERGEIEKGIRKLMTERENGGILTRAKDLKEKADFCIKEGGSTFQSLQNLVDFILNT
ncbi:UDP-glycosyltransferase 76F1, partial [Cucurbita argyrosperma subsp. argyrosperma]